MTDVWVLTIEHKYGRDVSVHANEEHALDELAEYVASYWDVGARQPDDAGDMIAAYFERNSGREHYSIDQCEIKG